MESREGTFSGPDGAELFYRYRAPDRFKGPTVVYVHGHGDHTGRHIGLFGRFGRSGIAVFAFDLRGHGRSPGPRGHIDSWRVFIDDVAAAVESQPRPRFLLGYSFGALVALDFARGHGADIDGLIAMAPPLGEVGIAPAKIFLARWLGQVLPRLSMPTGMAEEWVSRDQAVLQKMHDDELSHDVATARFGSEFIRAVSRVNAKASELSVPLLLLHGTGDRLTSHEGTKRFLASAGSADKSLELYVGAYHELDNDFDADRVIDDIVSWVKNHSK
jgi:alpha-beta hydrolase superfamily lysophospholipase